MWQDLDGLGGAGVNSGAHQVDQFSTTELTPEHQKILIDIRRKKTELLLEIQVSQLPYFFYLLPRDSVSRETSSGERNFRHFIRYILGPETLLLTNAKVSFRLKSACIHWLIKL